MKGFAHRMSVLAIAALLVGLDACGGSDSHDKVSPPPPIQETGVVSVGVITGFDYLADETAQVLVLTNRTWVPFTTFRGWSPYAQLEKPFGPLTLFIFSIWQESLHTTGQALTEHAAIAKLRSKGIQVVMLTGDRASTAQAVARKVGIDEVERLFGANVARLVDGVTKFDKAFYGKAAVTLQVMSVYTPPGEDSLQEVEILSATKSLTFKTKQIATRNIETVGSRMYP